MKYITKSTEVKAIKRDGTNQVEVLKFLEYNGIKHTTRVDGLIWWSGVDSPHYLGIEGLHSCCWAVVLMPGVAVTMTEEQFKAKYVEVSDSPVLLKLSSCVVDLSRIIYLEYNKPRTHLWAVMDCSTYNSEAEAYNNAPFVVSEEMEQLAYAWEEYIARSKLPTITIVNSGESIFPPFNIT